MTAPKLPDDVREKLRKAVRDNLPWSVEVFTDEAPIVAMSDAIIDAFLLALSESGRVVVPREPGPLMLGSDPHIFAFVIALHLYVHEADHPQGWSDFSDEQRERLKSAYRAMIAASEEKG